MRPTVPTWWKAVQASRTDPTRQDAPDLPQGKGHGRGSRGREAGMQVGMIGLGRMGANMVRRLLRGGHQCVVHDVSAAAVEALAREGATGAASVDDFVARLAPPRVVWLMVPAAAVDATLETIAPRLAAGDVIVDGGNSYYRDDIARAARLAPRGLHYVDCGTSGGVWGLERGYCLMIGGEPEIVARLDPLFRTLAPGRSAARAPGAARDGRGGVSPLRASRRGPLRQDGAQRHRVRAHGGLCRGAQHPAARQRRAVQPGGRRGDHAAAPSGVLPVRLGPRRDRGGLAAGQRHRLVASRPHRGSARRRPGPRALYRARLRFGRGALDARCGDRRGGAGARARGRALRALQLAGRGRLPGPAALRHALRVRRSRGEGRRRVTSAPRVLVIDVGGTHVKVLATGARTPRKIPSGPRMTAKRMVAAVEEATADWRYDVVSIGYPGPVLHGRPVAEPPNLGRGWVGFDFARALGRPVRLVNDAAMAALGSYRGGRMLFLGLGTGLGTAMIVDGVLEPMELAHLPYRKGRTYEEWIGRRGLKRLGKRKWRRAVADVVERLKAALEVEDLVIGGGNAKKLGKPPAGARLVDNAKAFVGGFRLWERAAPAAPRGARA